MNGKWNARLLLVASIWLLTPLNFVGCKSGLPKGVGPITNLSLDATVNSTLAEQGKAVFTAKCSACHKIDERYVGPALKGITARRAPEWIMNMILNPTEMTQKDETAKQLLSEFLTQMTFQNVTQDESRSILEYFRQTDSTK